MPIDGDQTRRWRLEQRTLDIGAAPLCGNAVFVWSIIDKVENLALNPFSVKIGNVSEVLYQQISIIINHKHSRSSYTGEVFDYVRTLCKYVESTINI